VKVEAHHACRRRSEAFALRLAENSTQSSRQAETCVQVGAIDQPTLELERLGGQLLRGRGQLAPRFARQHQREPSHGRNVADLRIPLAILQDHPPANRLVDPLV
jgi:hypothetical protein